MKLKKRRPAQFMGNYQTYKFKGKHPGLHEVCFWILEQGKISVPYCRAEWGQNNTINDIWRIVKNNTQYKHDATGIEQIQSVYTLLNDNIHGIPGAGDCDCFSVFFIALLLANNFNPDDIYIYLQGNSRRAPSHVLVRYKNYYLDGTETHFNSLRNYKFFDEICINELNKIYLGKKI